MYTLRTRIQNTRIQNASERLIIIKKADMFFVAVQLSISYVLPLLDEI